MAEDRFANVFTAELTMATANTTAFIEMAFGITLRDRIAIAIDEFYFYVAAAALAEMTTAGDAIILAVTVSDQVTNLSDLGDRRILYQTTLSRRDFGTAAAAQFLVMPIKMSFAPPMIALPNRIYFAVNTIGLASVAVVRMRMHYRTVSITQDQQLIEVLEAFQLST